MTGYCYLVGDVIHKGHILFLKNCKALCDKLIVGVLTDKAVMEKKPKPILSFDERMLIVDSIKYVDLVVPQDEYTPLVNALGLAVDCLFESPSHSKEYIDAIKEFLAKIKNNPIEGIYVMPYYLEQSSSKIKEKIIGKQE